MIGTRWMMGLVGAAALAGCGTTLKERAPTEGNVAARTMAFQESILAAIERSDTPKEAAGRISKYCERHADAFARLREDAAGLADDPAAIMALTMELMSGIEDLARRSQDALSDKTYMLEAPEVLGAIESCNVPMPIGEGESPPGDLMGPEPTVDLDPGASEGGDAESP